MKSAFLMLTFLAAISIALRNEPEKSYAAIVAALSTFIIASFLVCVFVPSIGLETSYQHAGKWKGLAGQKNPFGLASAVTFTLMLAPRHLLPAYLRASPVRIAVLLIAATCCWMSGSRGTLVDVTFASLAIAFIRSSARFRQTTTFLIAGFGLIALCFLALSISITGSNINIFGNAIDTSNRLMIWGFAFDNWHGRELLGVGYGGFWSDYNTSRFETLNGWVLPNFHNGYISIIIETGLIGCVLFLAFLTSIFRKILGGAEAIKHAGFYTSVGLIALFLVHNVYENNLTRSTDFLMLLFFISTAFVDRASAAGSGEMPDSD